MAKRDQKDNHDSSSSHGKKAAGKTTFLQGVLLVTTAVVLFFGLLEGVLALAGVEPTFRTQDPFVGFSGHVPLFTEGVAPNGVTILQTSPNKLPHFNKQMFVKEKAPDTYRIFCLGGSTTYGRPYNGLTAFPGWLRDLLPAAQKNVDWEVLNVGGISYASYRVARLMEELVQYKPDLFIIYTGQNEFLEERTYRGLRKIPEVFRGSVALLSRTRTWAGLGLLMKQLGVTQGQSTPQQVQLTAEVDTILEHSTGPKDYQRDDQLRDDVLEHFRVSLERMVAIAEEAGARVIFVTPASNLKDSSPFKSQHTAGLGPDEIKQVEELLSQARGAFVQNRAADALELLDQAKTLDPRYAEIHFRFGKVLFRMGRYDEALDAFSRARDEDVCPLRALSTMPDIVAEVARDNDLPLVDFVNLIENRLLREKGHRIPGEEYFLDHVHPTVEGHRVLSLALLETMIKQDIVNPDPGWGAAGIAAVTARIEAKIDPHMQAKALLNLSKVLQWAGKFEDAERLARQALDAARDDTQIASLASNILINLARQDRDMGKVDQFISNAFAADPWSPVLHYQLGLRLVQEKDSQRGASHLLLANAFWKKNQTYSVLGLVLYQQGRYELAYPFLKKALEYSPGDRVSQQALETLRRQLGAEADKLQIPEVVVGASAAGLPEKVYMQSERGIKDGYYTEWYEDGALKRYAEYSSGQQHGLDIQWDRQGKRVSTSTFDHDKRID